MTKEQKENISPGQKTAIGNILLITDLYKKTYENAKRRYKEFLD